jgi:hypothetical protein
LLVDDAKSHALEDRHAPGKRDRCAEMDQLEIDRPYRLRRSCPVELDGERSLGRQALDPFDVHKRGFGREILAIGQREGLAEALDQPNRLVQPERLQEVRRQAVAQVRTIGAIAASSSCCGGFGVSPSDRPMMKWTRASAFRKGRIVGRDRPSKTVLK